jgi:DNA-directed RNA polymerase specialized sigma24 family protein
VAALLDKYKEPDLLDPDQARPDPGNEAADVFSASASSSWPSLPHLREPQALPMWLIRVTSRECARWRRQELPNAPPRPSTRKRRPWPTEKPLADELLARLKESRPCATPCRPLPPRCRELIAMLFFETPPRPYQEIAEPLGLAAGSIGFIRGRCLTRLRRELEKKGFR